MCGKPKTPKDNSAKIAAEREAARQKAITDGRAAIDQSFSQFNDPYFQQIQQNALSYYNPQVQDQYENARRQMVANLARSGQLNSGAGARQMGDLESRYNQALGDVGNRALDIMNSARGDVERNKQDLYSLNMSAADPASIAAQAATRVGSITPPQSYSPLGDLFGSLLQSTSTWNAANQRYGDGAGIGGAISGLFGSRSTAKTVN